MNETGNRRFSITRTVGTIGVLFVIICTIKIFRVSRGNLLAFFDLPTFFFIAGFTFFLLLGTHGRKVLVFIPEAIKTFFFDPSGPQTDFVQIAKDGEKVSLAAGIIGVVLGQILLLVNLDDPSSIGPSMALSLLSIVYGLVFAVCVFGVSANAYQASPCEKALESSHEIGLVLAGVFAVVCTFFIMLFTFSPVSGPSKAEPENEKYLEEIFIETNLGQITEGHTIRFKACLNISEPKTKGTIERLVPTMQEKIIQLILKKEFAAMGTPAAFETLKAEVTSIVNALFKEKGCKEPDSIVFSEFLVR